jgi:hypothetical protein
MGALSVYKRDKNYREKRQIKDNKFKLMSWELYGVKIKNKINSTIQVQVQQVWLITSLSTL